MRLTDLKLAGFKSFADPTHIAVPGQIVGVVGPNGCGKSNIIDAMRWVLGESQARHLRGETMQDVIFNGAGERKPAGRSSVELVFDNSAGRAAGAWSQYAELSIKRVLHRNGESQYFINNMHVRRRDVTDLFLGTGVGARAYAIIEQGMISRIIEAKPEELRVFLEEAAGVSKYKERRRETELRLTDARRNLARVDDLRSELEKQIAHLEGQAEVAERYRGFQAQLRQTRELLWLVRRNEAAAQRERLQRELARAVNELEAETAALRETEARLEGLRSEHYAAGDALNAAQGELYAASAEVSRVENQLASLRESRHRLEQEIAQLESQADQQAAQLAATERDLARWREERHRAEANAGAAREAARAAAAAVEPAEAAWQASRQKLAVIQRELSEAEQGLRVEETHRVHAARAREQLGQRRSRLEAERQSLGETDRGRLDELRGTLAGAEQALAQARSRLAELEGEVPELERRRQAADESQRSAQRELAQLEARLNALQQLQRRLGSDEKLAAWLGRHGLKDLPRLWQGIAVSEGWEDALESTLRERLGALSLPSLEQVLQWLEDPPPARLAAFEPGAAQSMAGVPGLTTLRSLVACDDQRLAGVLDEWLAGVHVAQDAAEVLARRGELAQGAVAVTPAGHLVSRHGFTFHAPESELHGVLARRREIAELEAAVAERRTEQEARHAALVQTVEALRAQRAAIDEARGAVEQARQRHHGLQVEVARLEQLAERLAHRTEQVSAELAELTQHLDAEVEREQRAQEQLLAWQDQAEAVRAQLEDARDARNAAEAELGRRREAQQAADREAREAEFHLKLSENKINELERSVKVLSEHMGGTGGAIERLRGQHAGLDDAPAQAELQRVLELRQAREAALAAARLAQETATHALQEAERSRLGSEQRLEPLRSRIGDLRLKEQEAGLREEQFVEQLRQAGADPDALAEQARQAPRPAALEAEIARLSGEVEALGAVNLAAVEELAAGRERKGYLDSQAQDLTEAMETLEAAIRRIDRESRERLQETFDKVNAGMSELFPLLFGGGQAKLVMTGEEILDAGVQVVAQPPGKRNSSIHLLSGGEKALTAMSLVFSLFQLNPAPFCLLDEVDAPLDDANTERFCDLVRRMAANTQFMFVSHNKITMEMASHLIGITMQEQGVSHVVAVDVEGALRMHEEATV